MGFLEDDLDDAVKQQTAWLERADAVWVEIRRELYNATRKHDPMHSGHEGYAVILEELDELFEDVRRDNLPAAKKEAIQVAAMAIRFVVDLPEMPRHRRC